MSMATADPAATYAYVGALVDALARAGMRDACICPGSRSTPLALCLAAHPHIRTWVHIDERSAAYFALGLARASGRAVAMVCTSGTAAANFLPAVVEARYGRVPLLALTADRPPELRDVGAPQAIDQIHLYGGNVKWFVEMALPEGSQDMLRYARATAARAVAAAMEGPAGPIHLNLPFREPLVPRGNVHHGGTEARRQDREDDETAPCDERRRVSVVHGLPQLSADALADLAASLTTTPRGLIVCGPQPSDSTVASAIARLADALGYPILADPLSNVRCGPHDRALVLDAYDAWLRDERAGGLAPDVVIRFGAPPTSKTLSAFLQKAERHIVVDPDGGWRDPGARADTVVRADPQLLCSALARHADNRAEIVDHAWQGEWRRADRRARAAIGAYLCSLDEPFEGKAFAEVADLLPDEATLYAGNSMPVRDLDTFFPGGERRIRFLANRGANGIDGVVSSALGAAAHGDGPLVLVIGDLSFYHDLNGLLAARRHALDATIVLLNNDGGGIFSFLPQAEDPDRFEELFGTPTGLDFRPAVEMYGCGFERVATWPAFRSGVSSSLASPGVQVVELRTERARNVALHREVWAAVAEAVWNA